VTDSSGSWNPPPPQPSGPVPQPSPAPQPAPAPPASPYPTAPFPQQSFAPHPGYPPGYPPAPAYQPPAGYPAAARGPLGRPRGIGVSILLAIVTLGIYTYVWTWKTHDEIKRHAGLGVGGPLGFVIYFVVSPVTYFLLPSEVGQMLARAGHTSRVSGITGLWILLPLLGPLVWFVKVQGQLNDYWRSQGATG